MAVGSGKSDIQMLAECVNNLKENTPGLAELPASVVDRIKNDAMSAVIGGRVSNGSELAQFVIQIIKEEKDKAMTQNSSNNPFGSFSRHMIKPYPVLRRWSMPDPFASDDSEALDDIMELTNQWRNEYPAQNMVENFSTMDNDFYLMKMMAAITLRSSDVNTTIRNIRFEPTGTVYSYMEKYCQSNFKLEFIKTNDDCGKFAAGFLANLEYILNDCNASRKNEAVNACYDEFLQEYIWGDLCNAGCEKTTFKNALKKHLNDEIKQIINLKGDPMTNGIITTNNTNAPSVLPIINENDLDKLDAIIKIMNGSLGFKVADIYNSAHQYKAEAETLKKKLEAGQEPVGIKALTAEVGLIHMDWHDRLMTDVKLGRTVAVRGPAGNGKSTGIKGVLESAGYTIYHLDCTDSTTVDQLVGGLEPVPDGKGGIKMEFKDGVFAKAFKDAKGAIQLDEFDALDPRVTMSLQSALHRAPVGKKRMASCPDNGLGSIMAVGDCPVVVSMNTWGTGATREYVGRNAIDAASLDRFDTIINTDYQCEAEMLEKMGLAPTDRASLLKEVFSLRKKTAEKGLRVLLSTRRVLNMAESVLSLNCTVPKAISREFVERLDEYDRSALNLSVVG